MSDYVRYKGKLTKIEKLYSETLERQCRRLLEQENPSFELDNFYNTYKEYLENEFYDKYYISGEDIYQIESKRLDTDYDFYDGEKNEDGTIDFHVMYYDGGCGFHEALDEVMGRVK